jgi:hypothetical protein
MEMPATKGAALTNPVKDHLSIALARLDPAIHVSGENA